jgi:hypothetical protein
LPGDAAIIRREEELRQSAHHDRKPEGREDLHHAGIGLGPHRKAHDQEIDRRAEHQQGRRHQRRREQGIDGEEREQEEGRVHRDHQEFAMGEIHHVHQPENQRQPDGDQAVQQAHEAPGGKALNDGLGGHKRLSRFFVMAGLVPVIHVLVSATCVRAWMPATSPGMTDCAMIAACKAALE